MKTLTRNYLLIFWITLVDFFVIDFILKRWAVSESFKPLYFFRDFFYLTNYHKNEGIAFGISVPTLAQIIGSLIILYLIISLMIEMMHERTDAHLQMFLYGAIVGGGIGNLVDRLVHGFVVDFIVLWPFPIFNVADVGITVGLVLLFVIVFLLFHQDCFSFSVGAGSPTCTLSFLIILAPSLV